MSRSFTLRQSAALVVAAVGFEAVLSAATPDRPARHRLITRLAADTIPSAAHVLALIGGLALIVLAPKLWRGTRTAASLTIATLVGLSVLNLVKGLDYEETILELCLAAVLTLGRSAFPLGCRRRLRLWLACSAVGAWALSYCVLLAGPLVSDHGHTLRQALHNSLGRSHLSPSWVEAAELLIGIAVVISLHAVHSLLRPVAAGPGGHSAEEHLQARAIVERYGDDSLAPFVLRPDKAFHFFAGAVIAYRVIGETAVVSGDPVGPPDALVPALESFRALAASRGWQVVLWGVSERHVEDFRRLGLRSVRSGEEAFIAPETFTLEGRAVRKLRQSVHRVHRRGWQISAVADRELDERQEAEIERFERSWRQAQKRIIGFAMGMGPFEPVGRPDDIYLLARSPEGELRAVMRFAAYVGGLSLDTMHRLGETPNGLNEALVCRALEVAREARVSEVSLNYAGLAHLVRGRFGRTRTRIAARLLLPLLQSHFQMTRLVRFDEKFHPEWRARHLLYESPAALPRAVLRVLQAEGYLPEVSRVRARAGIRAGIPRRALPATPQADATG